METACQHPPQMILLDAQTQLFNLIRRSELESTIETLIKQGDLRMPLHI